ncbi:MAG: PQQ-dependent sugar dehydrogenase [Planctomycetes bacterium]|nr:PQQ-dependent sugar dehydrogenase [Planctomycetota bacterium]
MTVLLLAWSFVALQSDGDPDPLPDVQIEAAFPNLRFKAPVYVTHPKDGTDRLFVVERDGMIYSFENQAGVGQTDLALDISARVRRTHDEEGLLGLAFHPKFKDNGYVYLMYSASRPRRNVLSRFTMDAQRRNIRGSSERVLMQIPQPYGNHNGGMIEFGPDGYLYISLGDGGSSNDPHDYGQNKTTWLAKMLRIDVDRSDEGRAYAIPPDNPFVGQKNALPEIWAYGLRNMWRFSFDRAGGLLIGGDVGQEVWEEIDIVKRGCNYGWSAREGDHVFKRQGGDGQFEPPLLELSHRDARSVIGGYVYRGAKIPALQGAYVYGDFVTGWVWALRWDGRRVIENKVLGRGRDITTFGEDRDGEIYFASFDGKVYAIKPAAKD